VVEVRNEYKILVGTPQGKNNSEDLSADMRTVLACILGKQSGKLWTGFIRLREGARVLLL